VVTIGLILTMFAGLSEAVMDTLQFHFYKSPFAKYNHQYWNPQLSWRNKYKKGDPSLGPKFPGSTTIFVSLTDGWHSFKLLRNLFLFVGLCLVAIPCLNINYIIIYFITARILYGISFQLLFKKLGK
tara:strand:- start:479 stop:859 length:381 start_codon:yes stop_codon:yes gene_type:complete